MRSRPSSRVGDPSKLLVPRLGFEALLVLCRVVSASLAFLMLSAVIAFSGFSGPRLGLRPTEPQRTPLSRVRCQAEIYRLKLRTPLGIGFEERTPGEPDGVEVAFLVEGGNAEQDGRICVGDYLLRCSAVILGGEASLVTIGGGSQFTSWERELIPTSKMDLDTNKTAIGTKRTRRQHGCCARAPAHTQDGERAAPGGARRRAAARRRQRRRRVEPGRDERRRQVDADSRASR